MISQGYNAPKRFHQPINHREKTKKFISHRIGLVSSLIWAQLGSIPSPEQETFGVTLLNSKKEKIRLMARVGICFFEAKSVTGPRLG